MTFEELKQGFDEMSAKVTKIGDEVTATLVKVNELEAALAAAQNVPQDVQDKFNAVKAQLTVVDDLIPDAPAPTT